jgi:hypothetical protein
MKSRFSWMVITKRMLSYSLLVVMMLIYLVNLSTGESIFSDSEPAEQTELVFNEADPDFSTDYEIDPIDDALIHSFSNEFLASSLNMDYKGHMNSARFSGIHLEIPIPPPRLKS